MRAVEVFLELHFFLLACPEREKESALFTKVNNYTKMTMYSMVLGTRKTFRQLNGQVDGVSQAVIQTLVRQFLRRRAASRVAFCTLNSRGTSRNVDGKCLGKGGTANFVVTWDGCKAQSSMSLYTPSRKGPLKGETLGEYTAEHSGKFVAVAAFECRGVEPINWHPTAKVGYVAENVNGGKHPDVEFYKGDQAGYDWTGYDVEHNLNVEIMNLEFVFEKVG